MIRLKIRRWRLGRWELCRMGPCFPGDTAMYTLRWHTGCFYTDEDGHRCERFDMWHYDGLRGLVRELWKNGLPRNAPIGTPAQRGE